MERWFLGSYDVGDAHFGRLDEDGIVAARCGLRFVPQQRLFGQGAAFVQPPLDPLQACPVCRAEVPVEISAYSSPAVTEHKSTEPIPQSTADQDTPITQEAESAEGEIDRPDPDGAAVLGLIDTMTSPRKKHRQRRS